MEDYRVKPSSSCLNEAVLSLEACENDFRWRTSDLLISTRVLIVEGAETLKSRSNRAIRVIETLFARHANNDEVLVFSHGGILQYILAALIGTERVWGIPVHNTAVFSFTLALEHWRSGGSGLQNNFLWRIVHFNDASHLD